MAQEVTEYRCRYPHPRRPGRLCDRLLIRGRWQGEFELPCQRCGNRTVLDGREVYTAAQVDNVPITV